MSGGRSCQCTLQSFFVPLTPCTAPGGPRHQELQTSWRRSKFVSPYPPKLSPACVDLLNRLLNLDPAKRISLEEVQAHPWLQRRLPPACEAAWAALQARAARDAARLASLPPDQALLQQRNGRIRELLVQAAKPASADGPWAPDQVPEGRAGADELVVLWGAATFGA